VSNTNIPKIYVINLDRSVERWKRISGQLDSLSLSYERISAVEGAALPDFREAFNAASFKLIARHDLVPGEAGCSLSHIRIWEKILADNMPYALILEDDVVVEGPLVQFLNSNCFRGFDYLKIDTDKANYPYSYTTMSEVSTKDFTLTECDPVPFLTGGYIISNKGARIFLNSSRGMYYPVDILPQFTYPYTKQGFVFPQLVKDKFVDSNIPGRDFVDQITALESLRVFFLKLTGKFLLRKLSVTMPLLFRRPNKRSGGK